MGRHRLVDVDDAALQAVLMVCAELVTNAYEHAQTPSVHEWSSKTPHPSRRSWVVPGSAISAVAASSSSTNSATSGDSAEGGCWQDRVGLIFCAE
jgi:hypothetical protein